ncbi:MAG: hypothetical protein EBV92_12910 [Betaproteobacteria bacterium]|nr:hypothetical protein [Betaproteobacteria bacterium]
MHERCGNKHSYGYTASNNHGAWHNDMRRSNGHVNGHHECTWRNVYMESGRKYRFDYGRSGKHNDVWGELYREWMHEQYGESNSNGESFAFSKFHLGYHLGLRPCNGGFNGQCGGPTGNVCMDIERGIKHGRGECADGVCGRRML